MSDHHRSLDRALERIHDAGAASTAICRHGLEESRCGHCCKDEPTAENDVALIREAVDLIERERGAHPFHRAVADWLSEAADHLEARNDAASFPPGSVCPTALEGMECSMLLQAVVVAQTYVTPPAGGRA